MAVGIGAGAAVTVTVAVAVVEPAELVATSEYVVVAVGETLCDPLAATGAPFNLTLVASEGVHESIYDLALLMLAGVAVRAARGLWVRARAGAVAATAPAAGVPSPS